MAASPSLMAYFRLETTQYEYGSLYRRSIFDVFLGTLYSFYDRRLLHLQTSIQLLAKKISCKVIKIQEQESITSMLDLATPLFCRQT